MGANDGISVNYPQELQWGVPYFVGRLYFCDVEGLRELAIGIFIGGLIYVPLCLFEMRMSPQLHVWLYGFHQHNWRQAYRFEGWRPTVFMQHGLAVALWMVIAAMVGYWLWRTRTVLMLWKVPMSLLVPAVQADREAGEPGRVGALLGIRSENNPPALIPLGRDLFERGPEYDALCRLEDLELMTGFVQPVLLRATTG
jgi:hypothetical protein